MRRMRHARTPDNRWDGWFPNSDKISRLTPPSGWFKSGQKGVKIGTRPFHNPDKGRVNWLGGREAAEGPVLSAL